MPESLITRFLKLKKKQLANLHRQDTIVKKYYRTVSTRKGMKYMPRRSISPAVKLAMKRRAKKTHDLDTKFEDQLDKLYKKMSQPQRIALIRRIMKIGIKKKK